MVSEQRLRIAFKKVKEEMEGLKNELAFALKRIAHIESSMSKDAVEEIAWQASNQEKKPKKKAKKVKKAKKKAKHHKKRKLTWNQHLAKVRKKYPKKTLKQQMILASWSWKKKSKKKKL